MTTTKLSRVEALALAAATVFAVAIWLPWGSFGQDLTAGKPPTWVAPSDPLAVVGALARRPLLDATRGRRSAENKTSADSAAAAGAAMNVAQRYLLRGLARVDDRDVAVIEDQGSKRFLRLQRGQALGEWYLAAVSTTDATLRNQSGGEELLRLEPARARLIATTPVSMAVPAPVPQVSAPPPPSGAVRQAPSGSALPFGPVGKPSPPR